MRWFCEREAEDGIGMPVTELPTGYAKALLSALQALMREGGTLRASRVDSGTTCGACLRSFVRGAIAVSSRLAAVHLLSLFRSITVL